MTLPEALQVAVQHHRSGRLAEAEALYRQILAAQPEHVDALHFLGVIAMQVGRHDTAIEWIRQAIVLYPHNAEAHSNLGMACRAGGRLDEAIAAYRRAVELKPGNPETHNNLGAALAMQGRLEEALASFRRTLELKPGHAEAHHNLGNALRGRGLLDEAIAAYRRALELTPGSAGVCNALGIALSERGRADEATAAFQRALELKPDFLEACNNLGAVLAGQGRIEESIGACRRALEIKPDSPHAYNNLGYALREGGQLGAAVAACRRAIELQPAFAEAHNNLGAALAEQSQFHEGIAACRRAIELKPDSPEAHNNLGNALKGEGRLDEAIAAYRRSLEIAPGSAWVHSNLICTLHFHPAHDAASISEEHQRWNRRFSAPVQPFIPPHANDRRAGRRLRIGYVSPDFRDHPVGRYMLPLLERHDRERFEVLCYSGVPRPDGITERFRALAGSWRNTAGLSDDRLAALIREDAVDILVDLALHTAGNRLPMFARQPAPVQASFAGYPETAGVDAIAYRISDRYLEAGSRHDGTQSSEQVFLIDSFWCYEPSGSEPEVRAPPARESGRITFGCLNNFCKVNQRTLSLWARVLGKVKNSRLMILSSAGSHRGETLDVLERQGVESQGVEFVEPRPQREYLELYHRLDIALDTFPYNGHTTSIDALWMGAPVVSLAGTAPVSRAGLSQLTNLGLPELVAQSEEDYVRIAVELAGNPPRLAELRATMRARMQASPLMDAPGYARNVEAAYQGMWKAWLDKQCLA